MSEHTLFLGNDPYKPGEIFAEHLEAGLKRSGLPIYLITITSNKGEPLRVSVAFSTSPRVAWSGKVERDFIESGTANAGGVVADRIASKYKAYMADMMRRGYE